MEEKRDADPRRFRRMPAKEMSLKELTPDVKRVALLGTISAKDEEHLTAVFSDPGGQARLEFADPQQFKAVKEGRAWRVIGKPVFNDDAAVINVETVHEMKGVNQALFEKIRLMEKKFLG